jgi:hypothetical protein
VLLQPGLVSGTHIEEELARLGFLARPGLPRVGNLHHQPIRAVCECCARRGPARRGQTQVPLGGRVIPGTTLRERKTARRRWEGTLAAAPLGPKCPSLFSPT